MKSLLTYRRKHQKVPANTGNQDLFNCLPTEIILDIFQYLTNPADILSALNVCRDWRDILCAPEIWTPLADRLAPGLVTHIRSSTLLSTESQGRAFYSALNLQHIRKIGLFTRGAHHVVRLDQDKGSQSFFTISKQVPLESGGVHSHSTIPDLEVNPGYELVSRIKLYSHGRVAWWPEAWHIPFFAVIDDLRARTRRMYLFPGQIERPRNGQSQGWKTALGKFLFIMGHEDAGVCVWHLERNEMKKIALPGSFIRCVVQDERVMFVGKIRAELWLWDWEAARVKVVDVAAKGCYEAVPLRMGGQVVFDWPTGRPRPAPKMGLRFRDTNDKVDFILHPTDAHTFFVVTWDEVDLVVHEITSGEVTAHIVCPRDHLAYRIMCRSRNRNTVHYLRYERCDAYGGYCLLTAWVGTEPICASACDYRGGIASVCFNVYTKTFSAFVHHGVFTRTPDTHLWDGLLAVVIAGQDPNPVKRPQRPVQPAIAMLEHCNHVEQPRTRPTLQCGQLFQVRMMEEITALYTAEQPTRYFISPDDGGISHAAQTLHDTAYFLETRRDATNSASDIADWLSGDERTLIFASGKEYTVWTVGDVDVKKEGRAWRDRWRSVMVGPGRGNSKE
ncbi:hypothetical protein QBC35DRAFT_33748 [Podospora australis]|uniref:F-box domain-containing protein n=1 Tax=Podospora australis TaxID=1536484 RepID=A0AAN6X0H9_9PEZI|nr:hypothetical protein QBC35DRAFT_33748 [Podospora australis]